MLYDSYFLICFLISLLNGPKWTSDFFFFFAETEIKISVEMDIQSIRSTCLNNLNLSIFIYSALKTSELEPGRIVDLETRTELAMCFFSLFQKCFPPNE